MVRACYSSCNWDLTWSKHCIPGPCFPGWKNRTSNDFDISAPYHHSKRGRDRQSWERFSSTVVRLRVLRYSTLSKRTDSKQCDFDV